MKKKKFCIVVARHAVACFLTRGDLWQSWEDGMKVRNPWYSTQPGSTIDYSREPLLKGKA
jgi:FAD binding domain of DNA photolyase